MQFVLDCSILDRRLAEAATHCRVDLVVVDG